MDMGMLRVPVIDGDPIELSAEVLFHLPGEIAGEAAEIRHVHRVVGRDDETEVMAVFLTPLGESLGISVIAAGTEQVSLLPITGHALAAEIVEMCRERRRAGRLAHDARLDHSAARAGVDQPIRLDARALAAAEAGAVARHDAARAGDAGARFLSGGERLRDEGPGALRAR